MKTKLNVRVVLNTKSTNPMVTADLLLPKVNYVPGMGLKNTMLKLNSNDRMTVDDLELVALERPEIKVYSNREMFIECEADAFKDSSDGKTNYWINVKFSEHVKRTYFFSPSQLNKLVYEKYPFEFEEKTVVDQAIVTLPLKDKQAPDKK